MSESGEIAAKLTWNPSRQVKPSSSSTQRIPCSTAASATMRFPSKWSYPLNGSPPEVFPTAKTAPTDVIESISVLRRACAQFSPSSSSSPQLSSLRCVRQGSESGATFPSFSPRSRKHCKVLRISPFSHAHVPEALRGGRGGRRSDHLITFSFASAVDPSMTGCGGEIIVRQKSV